MFKISRLFWLVGLSRSQKRVLMLITDIFLLIFALWLSFSLRLDKFYLPDKDQWWIFVVAPTIALPIFIRFGMYRAIIRYIGLRALWTVIQAVSLYGIIWALVVLISNSGGLVPRSVYLLNIIIAALFIGGSRMIARWVFNGRYSRDSTDRRKAAKNVVIYGSGSAGMQLAGALSMGRELNPVAFIDDEVSLHNHQINGLKVYPFTLLNRVIEKYNVDEVLLALPSATQSRRNEIIGLLEPYPVHVRTIPGVSEIAQGKVKVEDIREIDIGDLLGRDSVPPNVELLHANITEKSVLVTGAGGSIGSELCRQIIQHDPLRLILFEMSEFQLYAIEKELESIIDGSIELIPILGSVVDKSRVTLVCEAFGVHTIYHAAAYKHVPMVERNPGEAIRNNILGTLHTAQAAVDCGVETFVLISTDKAVRPTNTMGATKRFAELILQGLSLINGQKTRFTMVRFGNVLGSSGSVVPLFRQQIEEGGPITVTDRKIIRYFMTIPEAAELVIQAGAMGQGGDVFVLDMGEPVRIDDLARRMIRLSGYQVKGEEHPMGDIEIVYTGLRPGEKLYEELLIGENVLPTEHDKIMRAEEEVIEWGELETIINRLRNANEKNNFEEVRRILKKTVSGFVPQCDVADEVQNAMAKKLDIVKNVVVELGPVKNK